MYLVTEATAQQTVTLEMALDAMEGVFAALDAGDAEVFPVANCHGVDPSEKFSVKSGLLRKSGVFGTKIGSYWPQNKSRGLANHASTVVLLDPVCGLPRALVQSTYLTSLRTAAVDAVAVRHLARADAQVLGLVGGGHQAFFDARAIALVRRLNLIKVWSRSERARDQLAARLVDIGLPAIPVDDIVEAADSDIVSTVTPVETPLVRRSWIKAGTHVSAMGADAPGKGELDPALTVGARCFADVVAQSVTMGEFEAAFERGLLTREDITPLGAVIRGRLPGRTAPGDVTLFDSSGVALQDLAIAEIALNAALRAGEVTELSG
jgi:ornithine cyclodeaminase